MDRVLSALAPFVRVLFALSLAAGLAAARAQAPTYRVTDLGTQFGAGVQSTAAAINDSAEVVIVLQDGNAYYWKASSGLAPITSQVPTFSNPLQQIYIGNSGLVGGTGINGYDISIQGFMAGPFVWRNGSGVQSLNQLHGFSNTTQLSFPRTVRGISNSDDILMLSTTSLMTYNGATPLVTSGVPGPVPNSFFYGAAFNGNDVIVATTKAPNGAIQNCPESYTFGVAYVTILDSAPIWSILNSYGCNTGLDIGRANAVNSSGKAVGIALLYDPLLGRPTYQAAIWDAADRYALPTTILANTGAEPIAINSSGQVLSNSYIWDPSFGALFLKNAIDPVDPLYSQITSITAKGINDLGLIVGEATISGQKRAVLLTPNLLNPPPEPISFEIVEPADSMISNGVITSELGSLSIGGRLVSGVAADGVANVLIRVSGGRPGERLDISLAGVGEQVGYLGYPGEWPARSLVSLEFDGNGRAFALYRAPLDFSWSSEHSNLKERSVPIGWVTSSRSGTLSMTVIRPLVVMLHGLWANDTDLSDLPKLGGFDESFSVRTINYGNEISISNSSPKLDSYPQEGIGSSLGVAYAVKKLKPNILQQLWYFARRKNASGIPVAASAVDIVGHSMGAVVARALGQQGDSYSYANVKTYGKGYIHKIISVGGPHLGSPIAAILHDSKNQCMRGWINWQSNMSVEVFGFPVWQRPYHIFYDCPKCVTASDSGVSQGSYTGTGAVGDLRGDADASNLSKLLTGMRGLPSSPTAYISGLLPSEVLDAFDQPAVIAMPGTGWTTNDRAPLLKRATALFCYGTPAYTSLSSSSKVRQLLSDSSDGLVPLNSQLNGIVNYPIQSIPSAAHSDWTEKYLYNYYGRPAVSSELSNQAGTLVRDLLNSPINNNSIYRR